MKRFLSVFLVFVVLLMFSVSCFAAYSPRTITLDFNPSTFLLVAPSTIYTGDTLVWSFSACDCKDRFFTSSDVTGVYPKVIDVYYNEKLVDTLVFDFEGDQFSLNLEGYSSGYFSLVAMEYHITGSEVDTESVYPDSIFNGYIEDSSLYVPEAVSPMEVVSSVFSGGLSMVSQLIRTICSHPLLIFAIVISLVGLGIGIFCRVKK